jgi:hypothetical protein
MASWVKRPQKKIFVSDRLEKARRANSRYYKVPPNSEQMKIDAETAKEWINDAPKVEYEVHRVDVDRTTGEASNHRISDWKDKDKGK